MTTGVEIATAYVSILPETSRFARGVARELDGVARDAQGVGRKAGRSMGSGAIDGTTAAVRRGSPALDKAGESLGRRIGRKVGAGLGRVKDTIFSPMVGAAVTAVVAGAGTIGIKTAAQLETSKIAFETMLGSAQKADAFLRDMKQFAAATPFELAGLQTSASQLIAAGIEADKVIPIMTTLGDVTSGMGTGAEGISRATVALQQMNAAQKISGEDLNQLRDAGIPVYDLLAEALQKPKQEIVELASKGKLGKDALDAMMKSLETGGGLEKFSGLMDKQSLSLTGLWSTLKDTFAMGMADAIEPLVPLIKDALGGAIEFMAAQMPKLRGAIEAIIAAAPAARDALGELIDFGRRLADAFAGAADSGQDIDVLGAAMEGVRAMGEPLVAVAEALGTAFGFIADHADLLAAALPTLIAGFAALKVVQAANSVLGRDSALGMTLQVASNLTLAHSNRQLAASYAQVNAAQATAQATAQRGLVTRLRATAATVASTAATIARTAATKAAAAGQRLLNLAMKANPIGLILTAITALVAGLVLAYKHCDTFRAAVDKLGAVVVQLWQTHLLPMLTTAGETIKALWADYVRPALTAIMGKAQELWGTVQPVFKAIGAVIAWVVETGIKFLWFSVKTYFTLVWETANWLWDKALQPVFKAIGAVIAWVVETGIKFLWFSVKTYFTLVWETANWLWDKGIRPTFNFIGAAFKGLANIAMWLWTEGIRPSFNFIADKANWLWDKGIRPALDSIKTGFGKVKDTTTKILDGIGVAFEKMRDAVSKPIRFVVERVINPMIRGYNRVNDVFSGDDIPTMPKFRTGGPVHGPGTGTSDSILARISNGEFIIRAKQALKHLPLLHAINNDELPAFAGGGIVGKIKGLGSSALGWLGDRLDKLGDLKRWLVHGIGSALRGVGDSPIGQFAKTLTGNVFGGIRDKIKAMLGAPEGGGSSGFGTLRGATYRGRPFPGGDIVTLGRWLQGFGIRVGEHPAFGGVAPVHKGRGHYRGAALDINYGPGGRNAIEMREFDRLAPVLRSMGLKTLWRVKGHFNHIHVETPHRRSYIPPADVRRNLTAYRDGGLVSTTAPTLYDQGGWLPTGVTLVENRTGRPERVVAPQDEAALGGVHVHVHGDVVRADEDAIADHIARKVRRAQMMGV